MASSSLCDGPAFARKLEPASGSLANTGPNTLIASCTTVGNCTMAGMVEPSVAGAAPATVRTPERPREHTDIYGTKRVGEPGHGRVAPASRRGADRGPGQDGP